MLAKTALLVLSNPKQINKILPLIRNRINNRLYIQLLTTTNVQKNDKSTRLENLFKTIKTPFYSNSSRLVYGIYKAASVHCSNLDVRVLLSTVKYHNVVKIFTNHVIDLVIFDDVNHKKEDIDCFVSSKIGSVAKNLEIINLDLHAEIEGVEETDRHHFESETHQSHLGGNETEKGEKQYFEHGVIGGTFDRLHTAHKLLLSEMVLLSSTKATVGVTEQNMIESKTLWELIEKSETRIENVKDFLTDICSELLYDIVPITDIFGPSIVDPTMDVIVVSSETIRGGEKINEIRKQKNLNPLKIVPVDLIDDPSLLHAANTNANEECDALEKKISSSNQRVRLLGTLYRDVIHNGTIPSSPYIIGLTGGVAGGKTSIAKYLADLGAKVINCDHLGHVAYQPNTECFKQIVVHFGGSVLSESGEIDRKALGSIVFKDPTALAKLNELVWPAIIGLVQKEISEASESVIVVEAAVLITAKWAKHCHEVWSSIIPRNEAILRLKERNNLTESEAMQRIDSQPHNSVYVENSNVIFSTLWTKEFTRRQVQHAWNDLQKRIGPK